jgi:cell division septation protein DedD
MSEQEFREIQLSSKQLIFLFMSAVVLAVSIFLLGVSVGRGVTATTPVSASEQASSGTVVPANPPPSAETPPLTYQRELQGQKPVADPPPAPPATQAGDAAAGGSPPASGDAGAPPTRNPSTGEVPPVTPAPAAQAPPPPPTGPGFDVQVGAFNSRPNADALVADLKSKGFTVFIAAGTRSQPRYIVRVGPYATRPEAEKAAATLADHLAGRTKPSVISR